MPTDEFYEHNRTVSKIVAVESGFFHVTTDPFDETVDLPSDDQGGAFIEMTVVHAVQMVNGGGEILVLHFNVPKAKNASNNETDFLNKSTINTDGADNQIQNGKVDEDQISLGTSMKGLLDIGDNT